jgi:hypothetical protein
MQGLLTFAASSVWVRWDGFCKQSLEEGIKRRRIILVVALVALLVVAAVVPAVADPSSTGLGSIIRTAAQTALPDVVLPDGLVSSDDATTDGSDSDSDENSDQASLNTQDSDGEEASSNSSDSDSDNSGSSSSGSSSSGSSVSQEFESEDIESGEASPSVSISNTGDNANLCAAIEQSTNTGNVANQQGATQYEAGVDEIEFEGSSITITPELAAECTQTIEQSSAAGA